ncbi:hypothetical protein LCGC14_0862970 [marine sediment metagenome]|uniref:Uncharacterized protein n=1 Tax=marine sediment metagenome TaxID=412755 RepID=A0A0F9P6U5_9ZZZZ
MKRLRIVKKNYVNGIVPGANMTRHFKIRKNGNISDVCPKDNEIKHNSVCKVCDDCCSFSAPLGIPTLIICKCSGIEGYNYHPHKKKEVGND